ncbi:hypothetical protein C8R47DRAFT_1084324 [Mycena vitilis]|nr:hypothetical protein C8R47DRAFT_1084324 [Mycena vitilis]
MPSGRRKIYREGDWMVGVARHPRSARAIEILYMISLKARVPPTRSARHEFEVPAAFQPEPRCNPGDARCNPDVRCKPPERCHPNSTLQMQAATKTISPIHGQGLGKHIIIATVTLTQSGDPSPDDALDRSEISVYIGTESHHDAIMQNWSLCAGWQDHGGENTLLEVLPRSLLPMLGWLSIVPRLNSIKPDQEGEQLLASVIQTMKAYILKGAVHEGRTVPERPWAELISVGKAIKLSRQDSLIALLSIPAKIDEQHYEGDESSTYLSERMGVHNFQADPVEESVPQGHVFAARHEDVEIVGSPEVNIRKHQDGRGNRPSHAARGSVQGFVELVDVFLGDQEKGKKFIELGATNETGATHQIEQA